MKGLSIVFLVMALLSACYSLDIQSKPKLTITESQMEQIENGMTYDQISSLLGSPGEREALPRLLLLWSQGACHLQLILKENKESGHQSWCDKVSNEIAGETYYKEVPNPFSDKIKSGMTYQEIIEAVGEPHQQREVFVYSWQGVDGSHKREITIYFADNKAFNINAFTLEEK